MNVLAAAPIVVLALAVGVEGCRAPAPGVDTPDAAASPQASAMPAPLAITPAPSSTPVAALLTDSGPPPVPMRGDQPLGADTAAAAREGVGYTLSAVLRAADVPAPPRAPEVNAAGIDAARKKTELRLAIDLTAARMRITLGGHGFVLAPDTEIRARADRFGHVVVWPGGATYRPLPPSALRALLGERRFDVAPIAPAEITFREDVGKRIGIKTRKEEVATRAAKATLEVGRLPELGEGGVLLCRLLLDLMNAPPQTPACGTDELPLRADLRWIAKGSLGFEVTGVLKRTDMSTASLAVPPLTASFAQSPFPVAGVSPMLSQQELAALRTGPVDVPAPQPGATTSDGLLVSNGTDELRVLEIDGVPALWAAPGARDVVRGLQRGRYVVRWRTFLGDSIEPAVVQIVPGSSQLGGVDASAR